MSMISINKLALTQQSQTHSANDLIEPLEAD